MKVKGIGDRFQEETKYSRDRMTGRSLDWSHRPEEFKTYSQAASFELPAPEMNLGPSLWEIIGRRRSIRHYSEESLTVGHLSCLLWACQGVTGRQGSFLFRAAPSAGALYPIETYLVVHNVDELAAGLYHYSVPAHALEELKTGDFRSDIARAALDQNMAAASAVVLVWTAVFPRSKWKYGQRAYRYVYLDAGHIAQNLALAAAALGLGSCQIAALFDEEINVFLGIDGQEESVLYLTTVGHPASG